MGEDFYFLGLDPYMGTHPGVITDRIFTKNANRPRICSAQAHSYLNRRRFAGPVRAKQPKNLSLRNAQSQLIQRLHWPGRSVVPF